ncbi:hypothetical protein, partial [Tropheryma whipplei]|uniref:hypothetical protein n=1 Tax=Tropheryma whipplei TaxID=2039 RepID=UPI0019D3EC06
MIYPVTPLVLFLIDKRPVIVERIKDGRKINLMKIILTVWPCVAHYPCNPCQRNRYPLLHNW